MACPRSNAPCPTQPTPPNSLETKPTRGDCSEWHSLTKEEANTGRMAKRYVRLTARLAKVYQRAINNHRKLEAITSEMRELSPQMLEATTAGVKKRKRQE